MAKPVPDKLNPGHDAAVRRMLVHDALSQQSSSNGAAEEASEGKRPPGFPRPAVSDRASSKQSLRR
jgi:hypothetical protein